MGGQATLPVWLPTKRGNEQMLTTDYIYRHWTVEDIFGDDVMFCPVCGQSRFVKLEPGGGVWCKECNANFVIRHTAGDPGVVVDCFTEHVRGYYVPEGSSFWQVLKDCDGGLDDRNRWCARVNGKLDLSVTRDKAVGVKKFQCKR